MGKAGTRLGPREIVDGIGRRVAVPRPVRRVVSLVPSLTDLCFALGAGARVVGVTDDCTEPAGRLGGIARVGHEKRPDLAVLQALAPDLVLANREENRREDVDRLADAGIAVHVSYPRSVDEGGLLCAQIGALVGAGAAGRRLTAAVRGGCARARRLAVRPAVPAAILVWRDPWLAVSGDAYGSDVLACLGGLNVFSGAGRRYPKVTLAALAALAPCFVLLPDEPYAFSETDADEVRRAVPGAAVVRCPGRPLFWHGPRAVEIPALAKLVRAALGPRSRAEA